MEFILGGLSYPDDSVKSSVVYVLVQVCSKSPPNSLGLPLVQNMCQYISKNLATAKSQELTVNLLGNVLTPTFSMVCWDAFILHRLSEASSSKWSIHAMSDPG